MFEQWPSHEHDRDGDDRDEHEARLEAPAPGRVSLTARIGTGATRPRRRRGTPGKVTRTAAMERGERDVIAPIVELLAGRLGLGEVPVYDDELGRARARAAGARGVMEGGAIFLDDERFDPETADGRRLLAHELAHVAQARLPVATGPRAGELAEAEAHEFAERFVDLGEIVPVRRGLPAHHLAAEGPAPAECLEVPALAPPDVTPVDGNPEAAIAAVDEELATIFDDLRAEPAFQDLVDASADASAAAEPALDELRETDTFAALAAALGRLLPSTGEPVQDQITAAFDAHVETCDATERDALDRVVAAATEDGVCAIDEARPELQTLMGPLPSDPLAIGACPTPPAPVELPPELAEPTSAQPPAIDGESPVCEQPAPAPTPIAPTAENTAAEITLPEEELAECEATMAVADDIAQLGATSEWQQLSTTLATVRKSTLGPFASAFIRQTLDTLVLDSTARLADMSLTWLTRKVGYGLAGEVPFIGPLVMGSYEIVSAGGFTPFCKAKVAAFVSSGQQLSAAVAHVREAWAADSGRGMLAETFAAQASMYGSVATFAEAAASICGVLAAVSFVGGFMISFTGVGASVTPAALAAGKLLAEACTMLGVIALGARASETLFALLSALVVPADRYEARQAALATAAEQFATSAGGFGGDAFATSVRADMHQVIQDQQKAGPEPVGREPHHRPAPETAKVKEAVAAENQRRADAVEQAVADAADPPKVADPPAKPVDAEPNLADAQKQMTDLLRWWPDKLGASIKSVQDAFVAFDQASAPSATLADWQTKVAAGEAALRTLETRRVALQADIALADGKLAEARASIARHQAGTSQPPADGDTSGGVDIDRFVVEMETISLPRLEAATAAARAPATKLGADLERAGAELAEARLRLMAEEAAAARRANPPADEPVKMPDASSGNSTGGVGSAFKFIGDWAVAQSVAMMRALFELDAVDAATSEIGVTVDTLEETCEVDGGDEVDDGAAAYWQAHGDEVGDDLLYLSDRMPTAVGALAEPPAVDPDALETAMETAIDAHAAYLHAYSVAYYLDDAERVLVSAREAVPADSAAGLVELATCQEEELAAELERTDAVETTLADVEAAQPPVPVDVLGAMAGAREIIDQVGGLTTAGELPEMSDDPALTVEAAYAQLGTAREDLAADRERLTTVAGDAQTCSVDVAATQATFEEDLAPLDEARDEAAAARDEHLAVADTHAAAAAAAAGEAATGLAELGAAGSQQQALLQALEEECAP